MGITRAARTACRTDDRVLIEKAEEENGYVYLLDAARRLIAAVPAYAGLVDHDEGHVRVRTAHGSVLTLNTDGKIVREDFVGAATTVYG
jgi:hypothetical protein